MTFECCLLLVSFVPCSRIDVTCVSPRNYVPAKCNRSEYTAFLTCIVATLYLQLLCLAISVQRLNSIENDYYWCILCRKQVCADGDVERDSPPSHNVCKTARKLVMIQDFLVLLRMLKKSLRTDLDRNGCITKTCSLACRFMLSFCCNSLS